MRKLKKRLLYACVAANRDFKTEGRPSYVQSVAPDLQRREPATVVKCLTIIFLRNIISFISHKKPEKLGQIRPLIESWSGRKCLGNYSPAKYRLRIQSIREGFDSYIAIPVTTLSYEF